MAKLIYGLKNGKLYHVDDVENGQKCECICPNCKEPLIARQGDINEHHFAHATKECDITKAQESALHHMAKEILAEYKIIKLPKFKLHSKSAFLPKTEYKSIDHRVDTNQLIYLYDSNESEEKVMEFTNVYVEQSDGNIIPDLICENDSGKLYIEIAVTNFVSENKKRNIINSFVPTIEINLSEYKDKIETLTKRRLADILIDDVELKQWIYNPQYQQDIDNIVTKNREIINQQLKTIQECCDMFKPKNYLLNMHKYIDDKYAENFWRRSSLYTDLKWREMPWFIGIPVYGDFVFEIDRRIWQTFVVSLIQRTKYDSTSVYSIWKYTKTKDFLRINPNFIEPIWIAEDCKLSAGNVIAEYYAFLQDKGVIDKKGLLAYGK